jgi:hypothetical protein
MVPFIRIESDRFGRRSADGRRACWKWRIRDTKGARYEKPRPASAGWGSVSELERELSTGLPRRAPSRDDVFAVSVPPNLVALRKRGEGIRHRHLAGLIALQPHFFARARLESPQARRA